jgi:hypothetical protein
MQVAEVVEITYLHKVVLVHLAVQVVAEEVITDTKITTALNSQVLLERQILEAVAVVPWTDKVLIKLLVSVVLVVLELLS